MFNVIIDGKAVAVERGTRVVDLIPDNEKDNHIICKIGTAIKELNYPLTEKNEGAEITLLDLDHQEASKAYETSLRYVVAMAFHRLYPDVQIRFSYNVSRAIFCQALTPGFNMSRATEPIKAEVAKIIAEDLPIERLLVSTEEAREVYNQFGHHDKLEILEFRPESTVHLYKCAEYYDYLHGYAAGTGNPYFSTDTGAVLRGVEIEADAILMAKNIDGIYSADPKKDPTAVKFDNLTYNEVLDKGLKATDTTAMALAMDNNIPMVCFGLAEENSILRVVCGEKIGTTVTN